MNNYPEQQNKTSMKLKVAADVYLQMFIKFNSIAIFHSYFELLYAALLESDPEVECFTPQPMKIMVKGKRYIPDFHYIKNNQSLIVELKPRGEFDDEKKSICEEIFASKDMQFIVVNNDYVKSEQIKAINWLQILKVNLSSTIENTKNQELKLMSDVACGKITCFGDVIDIGDRFSTKLEEISLYRLLYKHQLTANLDKELISYETGVSLCH
jgi:hypothetical protein